MSFLPGGEDAAEDMLNRLARPAFGNAQEALSLFEADKDNSAPALLPLPLVIAGTGAYLPRPLGDLHAASLAAPLERPLCTFFLRTGTCAYGDRCKFQHPRDRPPPVLNSRGYPVRPDEVDCAHYLKKGWCAFNLTCKFNHPELPPPVLPGSPYLNTALPYAGMTGVPGGYGNPGAMYGMQPSAMPVMYYMPSPVNPTQIGGGNFPGGGGNGGSYPVSAAALQAAYGGGGGAGGGGGLATAAGVAYRQQQQQTAASAAVAAQHQAVYGGHGNAPLQQHQVGGYGGQGGGPQQHSQVGPYGGQGYAGGGGGGGGGGGLHGNNMMMSGNSSRTSDQLANAMQRLQMGSSRQPHQQAQQR